MGISREHVIATNQTISVETVFPAGGLVVANYSHFVVFLKANVQSGTWVAELVGFDGAGNAYVLADNYGQTYRTLPSGPSLTAIQASMAGSTVALRLRPTTSGTMTVERLAIKGIY